jgi:hypothetical protein
VADYQRIQDPPFHSLLAYLADGGWHKSPEICQACGFTDSRPIRELAETTDAIIGGPKGYKRADLATAEELEHAGRSLCSRGSKTTRRGQKYTKMANALRSDIGPLFASVGGR